MSNVVNAWDDPRIVAGMTAQLAARRARIDKGDRPVGWKVGFGAAAMREKFRVNAPLVGSLLAGGLVEAGGTASLAGWTNPVAEPEIAVYLAKDVPAHADRATASAAVGAIGPIFELIDLAPPPEEPEAVLRGNIYHRHVVTGPRDPSRAGLKLDGLTGRVFRNGAEYASTAKPTALPGDLVETVRHVATLVAAFGEKLRAGEMVITGSIVPPIVIQPGDAELEYRLEPVGATSVRFTR